MLNRILRAGEGRAVKRLGRIAEAVSSLEDEYSALTDEEITAESATLRERAQEGESLDSLLPEAFALAREAARRTIGQRPFDVQIMGAAALHHGSVAEMKTGEGKTLTAVLAAYLNSLTGEGVHVVTTNDYLARRDAETMGPIYHLLGASVGTVLAAENGELRRQAYSRDVTYGTNNEFGFDYLRDNMAPAREHIVQRGHVYAIVDEVDSILIDEARTPLIISGPSGQDPSQYTVFAKLARRMRRGVEYDVDEAKRTVSILEEGVARAEGDLRVENLYELENAHLVGLLQNALKAKELYLKDRQYITSGGEVLIVDEFTGRVLSGRRYSEGLHQAIEAKEGVRIQEENQTLATITLQNYFRLYDKLAGMTGTAATEAAELSQTYKLNVVQIPTNRPMIREDRTDLVYRTEQGKLRAVVEDIAQRHEEGQPVLVGTASVEKSELLSKMLLKRGIPHDVLNAKQHEKEARIVAQAGRRGAVTVSTNMAGRGTDILLGGNPELLAREELQRRGVELDREGEPEGWSEALEEAHIRVEEEREQVIAAGGLHVLGTERHEARRIDNQLRGRSGRQGDPGSSQFYLSLEDDLLRLFNTGGIARALERLDIDEDLPLESKLITRAVQGAQAKLENRNFEVRKNVLKYDEVLSRQREVVYTERREILEGGDLSEQIREILEGYSTRIATAHTVGYPEEWDLEALWAELEGLGAELPTVEEYLDEHGPQEALDVPGITRLVKESLEEVYTRKEQEFGEDAREVERLVLLSVLDRRWQEHLHEMDYLKEGIGLRATAQRDPLVEYQREGYELFVAMMDALQEEVARVLLTLQRKPTEVPTQRKPERLSYHSPGLDGDDTDRDEPGTLEKSTKVVPPEDRIARNAPCPCGSGKKYKRCHGVGAAGIVAEPAAGRA